MIASHLSDRLWSPSYAGIDSLTALRVGQREKKRALPARLLHEKMDNKGKKHLAPPVERSLSDQVEDLFDEVEGVDDLKLQLNVDVSDAVSAKKPEGGLVQINEPDQTGTPTKAVAKVGRPTKEVLAKKTPDKIYCEALCDSTSQRCSNGPKDGCDNLCLIHYKSQQDGKVVLRAEANVLREEAWEQAAIAAAAKAAEAKAKALRVLINKKAILVLNLAASW